MAKILTHAAKGGDALYVKCRSSGKIAFSGKGQDDRPTVVPLMPANDAEEGGEQTAVVP